MRPFFYNIMKTFLSALALGLALAVNSLYAETLFGPGVISIATNETILFTAVNVPKSTLDSSPPTVKLDGVEYYMRPPPIPSAITGPHSLLIATNSDSGADFFLTFQRLVNSPIKTVVTTLNTTNFINVAAGKTIQLFSPMGNSETIWIQPQASTKWYRYRGGSSITGPATISMTVRENWDGLGDALVFSYFFADEVVQFPPAGLLNVPAPILEVNIEKSYNLSNWVPSATFHTEAETGAFYRLRMLK